MQSLIPFTFTLYGAPACLTDGRVWMYGDGPGNHDLPVMTGVTGGWQYETQYVNSFVPGTHLSHLDRSPSSFNLKAHRAPGFAPPYVMNYGFDSRGMKRLELTLQELRALQDLGYILDPAFLAGPGNAVNTNTSPYTDSWTGELDPWVNGPYSEYADSEPADFFMANSCGALTIELGARPELHDDDNDQLRVAPGSLFNIRGCGNGGNNHSQLTVAGSPNGDIITFIPRPDFIGRAQFGFHLWDGQELGDFVTYTVDVSPGSCFECDPDNLVINGDFEEGTEVKLESDDGLAYSSFFDGINGQFNVGRHMSDGHPLHERSWYFTAGAGAIVRDSYRECANGEPLNSGFGYGQGAITTFLPFASVPSTTGDRYSRLAFRYNPSELCEAMECGKMYRLKFNVNFDRSTRPAGSVLPIIVGFYPDAGSLIPYNPFPGNYDFSHQEDITVPTAGSGWIPVQMDFQYCGEAHILMNIEAGLDFADNRVYYDDIILFQLPDVPLAVDAGPDVTVTPGCDTPDCAELQATPTDPHCELAYSWSPAAGLSDPTSTLPNACPDETTTYTVTVTDECGTSTTDEVTVTVTEPGDCFTITKTASISQTYAWSTVTFTITICNISASPATVNVSDALPSTFVMTGANPFVGPITLAPGCTDFFITGYYTEIGDCDEPGGTATHTNTVTLTANGQQYSANDCVDILVGCPMSVSGNGGCGVGDEVEMCLLVHTELDLVTTIDYQLVYPSWLSLPGNPAANTVGPISPSSSAAPLDANSTISWAPYDAQNNIATIHVQFQTAVNVAPPWSFLCMTFTINAPPPVDQNIFPNHVISPGGDVNLVTINSSLGILDFWTQAWFIFLEDCPSAATVDASFTVEVPNCGGAVTVHGNEDASNAVHVWTWGDNRTTPTNGAPDWTYDYFSPFTVNQTPPVTLPPSGPGTYIITHTVVLDGAYSTSEQTITIYECCAAAIAIEDGTTSSSLGVGYSMTTLDIQGQFIVDGTFTLDNCTVYLEPGAEIIVTNGNVLDVNDCDFSACRDMWRSITVENGGAVYLRRSTLADAQYAVKALDGSLVVAYDNYFHRDYVGIHVPDDVGWNNVIFNVHGNEFATAGPLTTPYPGQTPALGTMSFAGIDVHDMALDLTDGGGSTPPNRFIGLSNGVRAERSDVRMNNCVFDDIQPDAAYGTANDPNGAAVYAYDPGGRGFYSLRQEGFGMSGMNAFEDCRWGIYTEYMSVRSESNKMLNVGTAYHIERSSYRLIDILNNTLDTRFDGIQLYMNDGCEHMLVLNNHITFATNPPPGVLVKGYTAINVKEANTANPSSVIQGNSIWYRTGASTAYAGISLNSANNYLVANNDLHMYSNAYNYAGIILSGSRRPVVSCNNVLGSFNGYNLNDGQSAIRNNQGGQAQIFCNEVDGTVNGLYFSGAASGTDLSGNLIRNHKWGLHLDNNAVIDQQYWKGNLWYNNPQAGGWGAWYENAGNAFVYTFKVDPTITLPGSNPMPPSRSPSYWFDPQPGQNYLCDDGAMNYCAQFYHERCEDCKTELDERTAEGELQNNPYTDETKWMMEGDLYKKLNDHPDMMDNDQALADFYAALQSSVTAQFKSINDDYLRTFDLDATVRTYLAANRTQMEVLMGQVRAAVGLLDNESLTEAQRAAIVANIEGLNGSINALMDLNTQALELAASTKNLSAGAVRTANAQVGASELIGINERQVNHIYLSTVARDIDAFTATEVSQLFDVANQCPMLGGNAVYRARSLYALIDDEAEFDDPALCLQHGIIMRSAEQPSSANVAILPNPACDEATLVYTLAEGSEGFLLLYDAIGKQVIRYRLGTDMTRFTFNTSDLAPGAYHYLVEVDGASIGDGKLMIAH